MRHPIKIDCQNFIFWNEKASKNPNGINTNTFMIISGNRYNLPILSYALYVQKGVRFGSIYSFVDLKSTVEPYIKKRYSTNVNRDNNLRAFFFSNLEKNIIEDNNSKQNRIR